MYEIEACFFLSRQLKDSIVHNLSFDFHITTSFFLCDKFPMKLILIGQTTIDNLHIK